MNNAAKYSLLRDIELPTSVALFHMEHTGASVDRARLDELLEMFTDESNRMEQICYEAAGHEVNLQSPKQLGVVLFEEMGLNPTKKTKKRLILNQCQGAHHLVRDLRGGEPPQRVPRSIAAAS